MSKIISFSISDRYLDQIRSLYPSLTDNLAVKQFLTDRLDSSLDVSLDASLDGRVRSLVESELDGILDVRLDAAVGKMIGDLFERLSRLESRLDGGLDGELDGSLDGEASIASFSPIPNGETVEDADSVESADTVETANNVEDADKDDPGTGAIGPVPDEKGLTDSELARLLGIDKSNITRWKQRGEPTPKYRDKWELRGRFWYERG